MLDALRHFLLVVDHGTITEAARRAHLSQPAMTAAIQRLEETFGARLLDRGARGARPTAAGAALVPRARAAIAAVDDGARAVAEIAGLRAGEVRVGAGATACTYLLPPRLAAFRAKHPAVRLILREANADVLIAGVERGELDLAIAMAASAAGDGDDVLPAGVVAEAWTKDTLVVVAAPELVSGRARLDLARAPFVALSAGSTTRALLERHFPRAPIVAELGSIAAVKGNVRAGVGVALVSRAAVETDLTLGRLVVVPHRSTPIPRLLSLVHRGADRLPPAAAALRWILVGVSARTRQ